MSDRPPPEPDSPFARFAALVRRELGAEDVRIVKDPGPDSPAANVLYARLLDGTRLAVTFASTPENAPALRRRLGMLVGTFTLTTTEDPKPHHRVSISRSLREELRALATRTQAIEALVLDAHSPVVWGITSQRGPLEEPPELSAVLHVVDPLAKNASVTTLHPERVPKGPTEAEGRSATAPPPPPLPMLPPEPSSTQVSPDKPQSLPPPDLHDLSPSVQRAIREVRALPGVDALRKGRALRESVRSPDFGYVAQSFAAIYILVLVFEEPFDELRAERAIGDALPRIERLVLALPPLDPTPEPRANAVALRRPRRR